MSNDPYDKGRFGGQPPSGADYNEWWRGYQDHLKGLQQGDSGDSTGPLLGDDPHAEPQWPRPPQTFNSDEQSGSEGGGNPYGFTVDSGCAVLLLAALALCLVPVILVTWAPLHPSAPAPWNAGTWLLHRPFPR